MIGLGLGWLVASCVSLALAVCAETEEEVTVSHPKDSPDDVVLVMYPRSGERFIWIFAERYRAQFLANVWCMALDENSVLDPIDAEKIERACGGPVNVRIAE
jgi:formylmethanofuran dehydrogenase subunit A